MHVQADLFRRMTVGESDELREVEDGHVDRLVGALERRLVQVELLEARRADDDQRVHLVFLQVVELAARECERRLALAHAIERATAALHLGGIVDDEGAESRHELLDLLGVQRVVPPHRGLRTQEVATVVHGQPHPPERLGRLACDETGAHGVGEPLGEVDDLQLAVVVQVLAREPFVDLVALAPVRPEMALRFLERRVAAVARRHDIEPSALHEREVASRGRVEGVRVVRLHERALRTARVPFELVHCRAEVVEHHPCRLLDEGEPRGDRASPKDREILHVLAFLLSRRAGPSRR